MLLSGTNCRSLPGLVGPNIYIINREYLGRMMLGESTYFQYAFVSFAIDVQLT